MLVLETSWVGVIAVRTLFWRGVCPIWRERSEGGVWLLSSTSYGRLVRRWGQTLLGGTQQKATGKNCRGELRLERKKNVHHGDSEALDLLPGEVVGSLLWKTPTAYLDQASASYSTLQVSLAPSRGWTGGPAQSCFEILLSTPPTSIR